MKHLVRLAALAGVVAIAAPAAAVPVITNVNANLAASPFTFSFMGGSFTFGSTGDIFAPLSVSTGGGGLVNSFFGQPTSFFVDRGTVSFGPNSFPSAFTAFPTPTTVPSSNGNNFIGLAASSGGMTYYGFAYTTNTVLNSYGFETVAGQTIIATVAPAVPEPGTWALMMVGFGAVGYVMRRRRVRVAVA